MSRYAKEKVTPGRTRSYIYPGISGVANYAREKKTSLFGGGGGAGVLPKPQIRLWHGQTFGFGTGLARVAKPEPEVLSTNPRYVQVL